MRRGAFGFRAAFLITAGPILASRCNWGYHLMKMHLRGAAATKSIRPLLSSLCLALLAATASAQAADIKLDDGGFNAASDDGQYTFGIHGRIQMDGGWFDNDDIGDDNIAGTELRRVRLAVSGKIQDWSYLVDYDFAGGGYFLNNFAIALFRFFETLFGSLPEPNVFVASPRQICFFWATS